jgi:hypothetical protein
MNRHLGPHLEAARADAWADHDFEILRPAAELPTHAVDGFRRDFRYNSTPAGVNRSHSPCSWIHNEDRQAVRGSNRESHARPPGNKRIARAQMARFVGEQYLIRMNLFRGGQAGGIQPVGAQACAEAVTEPGELREPGRPVHVGAVKPEQFSV